MWKYFIKRILYIIPTLLIVTVIVFTIMSLTPGSPARLILGSAAPKEAVDMLNEELGVNDPFFMRLGSYLYHVIFKGNFGISYQTQKPVMDYVMVRFGITLRLTVIAIAIESTLGVSIGILSAIKQYSKTDTSITVVAMLMASIPVFWLGLMLIYVFSVKLGWLPSFGLDSVKHYVLPMLSIVLPMSSPVIKMSRSAMLETIRQDYVRTARAKGASEKRVILHHALENALLPIITILAASFGMLLGGAIITESVFSIPGMGTGIITAIKTKDTPMAMAIVLILALVFCIIMLVVDLLYAMLDPRVKAQFAGMGRKRRRLTDERKK